LRLLGEDHGGRSLLVTVQQSTDGRNAAEEDRPLMRLPVDIERFGDTHVCGCCDFADVVMVVVVVVVMV
jgi:hypothetical protein